MIEQGRAAGTVLDSFPDALSRLDRDLLAGNGAAEIVREGLAVAARKFQRAEAQECGLKRRGKIGGNLDEVTVNGVMGHGRHASVARAGAKARRRLCRMTSRAPS